MVVGVSEKVPRMVEGVAWSLELGGGPWSQGVNFWVPHGLHAHPWALRRHPGGQRYQLQRTRGAPAPPPDPRLPPAAAVAAAAVVVGLLHDCSAMHPKDWDALESEAVPPLAVGPTHFEPGVLWPGWLGAPTPPESGVSKTVPSARSTLD